MLPGSREPEAAMRYLYGSGEAAAIGVQAYRALGAWLKDRARDKAAGQPGISTILARGATLDRPVFVPCGDKPLAVVFDIDETVLLNLGFESHAARTGAPYDEGRWQRWESTGADKVAPVPGALEAISEARSAGITVVFNSNRSATNAAATAAALQSAGLGPAVRGDTLWLKGDAGTGSGKDERRWRIAEEILRSGARRRSARRLQRSVQHLFADFGAARGRGSADGRAIMGKRLVHPAQPRLRIGGRRQL